jgi:hypothetical protein
VLRRNAFVELLFRHRVAKREKALPRKRTGIRRIAVQLDDGEQVRQAIAHRLKFRELFGVLDERDACAAMLRDVLALLGGVRRVDAGGDRAGGNRRRVGDEPLGTVIADDRDVLVRRDAERDQRTTGASDVGAVVTPADCLPRAVALDVQRGLVGACESGAIEGVEDATGHVVRRSEADARLYCPARGRATLREPTHGLSLSPRLMDLTLPPAIPRRGGPITRAIGRAGLKVLGWRIEGAFPNRRKMVLIAAPHRSNWDFVVGIAGKFALGIDVSWLGKHTLFRGPWGALFKRWGGIPVDRRASNDTVATIVAGFANREHLLLAITPEGTRKAVGTWKSGFWYIASGAGIPILPVAFDWDHRVIRILPPVEPGDRDEDMREIQALYADIRGRHA